MIDVAKNKEQFLQLCRENIHREGLEDLLKYLCESDFFVAPCSTKHHLSERGGLCEHSLNVYIALLRLYTEFMSNVRYNVETLTIIALFHDLCKVDFYKKEFKPVKRGSNWVQEEVFVIDDTLPLGHGEKSVIRIMQYMKLTFEEMIAIRWHMGAWDNAVKGGDFSINSAQDKSKLVTMLHCADMIASQVIEK